MDEIDNLNKHLDLVDIERFRKDMLNEWVNFKRYKTLDPFYDKKGEEYWKYISMAFFNDPNLIFKEKVDVLLSERATYILNKLNDTEEILKKVIIISNQKHIRYFNLLANKNISLQSLIVAIKNLPE
jgi:hypothetical protein